MADSKNIVVCPYHHFYDGDKYKECPECAKGKGPNVDYQKSQIKIEPMVSDDKQHTKRMSKDEEKKHQKESRKPTNDDNPTQFIWDKFKKKKKELTESKDDLNSKSENPKSENQQLVSDDSTEKKQSPITPDEDRKSNIEAENDRDTRDLQEVIKGADVDQDDVKTISVYGSLAKVPVGWLIAIEGNDLGTDYRIVDGKNLVGRDPNMNISIQKDKSVSRDTHTVILYDAEGHDFYLLPNEGKGTVHLNKQIALSPTKLHKGDKIKIGNTLLYFLPLCDEDFDWNDYV